MPFAAQSVPKVPHFPNDNGYFPLPHGKLATLVTYFERLAPFAMLPENPPAGVQLERLNHTHLARYRAVFRAVGEPWLWVSRLTISDTDLDAVLREPTVEAFVAMKDGRDIGFVELDFRTAGEAELRYLGVIPGLTGSGLGRWLMAHAINRASATSINRLWLHTCHFDSPQAMDFYRKSGFVARGCAVELIDDPRLSGDLPLTAAPHIPLIVSNVL